MVSTSQRSQRTMTSKAIGTGWCSTHRKTHTHTSLTHTHTLPQLPHTTAQHKNTTKHRSQQHPQHITHKTIDRTQTPPKSEPPAAQQTDTHTSQTTPARVQPETHAVNGGGGVGH